MAFSLDHVVIAVSDLEQAMQDYRALGFTVMFGGKHTHSPTHNALIYFRTGAYIELLARTEGSPQDGGVDFSPLISRGEGLVGYCLGSDDLEADLAGMRARGIPAEPSIDGGRKRADGAQLIWKTGRIGDSFAPFFIQDVTPRELRVPTDSALTTHANGVTALVGVEVITPLTDASVRRYQNMLGIAPDEVAIDETVRTFSLSSGHLVLTSPEATDSANEDEMHADIEASSLNLYDLKAVWQQILDLMQRRYTSLTQVLYNATVESVNDHTLTLSVGDSSMEETLVDNERIIRAAIQRITGFSVDKINVVVSDNVQNPIDTVADEDLAEINKITSHTFRAYMRQTFESRRRQYERNGSQETLYAAQVLMESVPNISSLQEAAFALDKTHGVRFIQAGLSTVDDGDDNDEENV